MDGAALEMNRCLEDLKVVHLQYFPPGVVVFLPGGHHGRQAQFLLQVSSVAIVIPMHTRNNPPTGRGLILGNALHTRTDHTNPLNSSPNRLPTRDLHQLTGRNLSQLGCYPYSFIINPLFIQMHRLVLVFLLKMRILFQKYGSVHFQEFWFWTGNLGNRTGSSVPSSRFFPVHWFAFPFKPKE